MGTLTLILALSAALLHGAPAASSAALDASAVSAAPAAVSDAAIGDGVYYRYSGVYHPYYHGDLNPRPRPRTLLQLDRAEGVSAGLAALSRACRITESAKPSGLPVIS